MITGSLSADFLYVEYNRWWRLQIVSNVMLYKNIIDTERHACITTYTQVVVEQSINLLDDPGEWKRRDVFPFTGPWGVDGTCSHSPGPGEWTRLLPVHRALRSERDFFPFTGPWGVNETSSHSPGLEEWTRLLPIHRALWSGRDFFPFTGPCGVDRTCSLSPGLSAHPPQEEIIYWYEWAVRWIHHSPNRMLGSWKDHNYSYIVEKGFKLCSKCTWYTILAALEDIKLPTL